MNIGITFGGYAPLHQGHLDLIMRAKKENDMTFVIVCGYDNEPRTESLGLNLTAKTTLIKDFLEDDVLKVFSVNDTELGIDESMSDYNWKVWLAKAYADIAEYIELRNSEITFNWYVAESNYKDAINKNSLFTAKYRLPAYEKIKENIILVDRTENPISGTLCRENPLKYWNKIAQPFRRCFSNNILIAGTSSEGKTTLVNDISKYFGLVHSYEKGRDNCKWKTDDQFNFKDFMYNLYEQHKCNEELINSDVNTGVFISDTDNMVTLMYAHSYAERESFALTMDDYCILQEVARGYIKSTKWSKIFLLAPHEKPIVDDGERYMPDSDYNIRKEYFDFLKLLYDEAGYEYEILDGNYYENYSKVKEYINSLYD